MQTRTTANDTALRSNELPASTRTQTARAASAENDFALSLQSVTSTRDAQSDLSGGDREPQPSPSQTLDTERQLEVRRQADAQTRADLEARTQANRRAEADATARANANANAEATQPVASPPTGINTEETRSATTSQTRQNVPVATDADAPAARWTRPERTPAAEREAPRAVSADATNGLPQSRWTRPERSLEGDTNGATPAKAGSGGDVPTNLQPTTGVPVGAADPPLSRWTRPTRDESEPVATPTNQAIARGPADAADAAGTPGNPSAGQPIAGGNVTTGTTPNSPVVPEPDADVSVAAGNQAGSIVGDAAQPPRTPLTRGNPRLAGNPATLPAATSATATTTDLAAGSLATGIDATRDVALNATKQGEGGARSPLATERRTGSDAVTAQNPATASGAGVSGTLTAPLGVTALTTGAAAVSTVPDSAAQEADSNTDTAAQRNNVADNSRGTATAGTFGAASGTSNAIAAAASSTAAQAAANASSNTAATTTATTNTPSSAQVNAPDNAATTATNPALAATAGSAAAGNQAAAGSVVRSTTRSGSRGGETAPAAAGNQALAARNESGASSSTTPATDPRRIAAGDALAKAAFVEPATARTAAGARAPEGSDPTRSARGNGLDSGDMFLQAAANVDAPLSGSTTGSTGFTTDRPTGPAPAGTLPALGTPITARLNSAQFAGQLTDRVMLAIDQGLESAQIHITPEELGPVRIELSMRGDTASIAFMANNPETRSAIESSLDALRERMRNDGIVLSNATVGADTRQAQSDNSGTNSRNTASGNNSTQPDAQQASPEASTAAPASNNLYQTPRNGNGRVDLFA